MTAFVCEPRVVALTGGVGGAKLVLGLDRVSAAGDVTAIVNTGDDFEHLGLYICPDLDTALYTLAGISNPELGWGREAETWSFMQALEALGGPSWFRLGDGDLAVHVERTQRLRSGVPLSQVIREFAARLGVKSELIPMSEEPVRTLVQTDQGVLGFQDYFVRLKCAPAVRGIHYSGLETARAAAAATAALSSPRLEAICICPSNPYLSIDPILATPGMRDALRGARVPIIAVSPLIGGVAVKGPTAKIMRELGVALSPATIAAHYAPLIDGIVLDEADAAFADSVGVAACVTGTLMNTLEDKMRVAERVLAFAREL